MSNGSFDYEREETEVATESVFIVTADEKLTAFLELERAIHGFAVTVSQESVFNDCKAGFANGEVHRI
jgi:hypothetical protein